MNKLHTKSFTLCAPASLLLFGEYFITEKNTKSLCMAVSPHASAKIDIQYNNTDLSPPLTSLCCITHSTKPLILPALKNILYKHAYNSHTLFLPLYKKSNTQTKQYASHVKITIDTSRFFIKTQKRGLGSSEVSAVLMCAAIAIIHGIDPLSDYNKKILAAHASTSHRMWQGNRGSGYGVYTSVFGELGIYLQRNSQNKHSINTKNTWQSLPQKTLLCFQNDYTWLFWNHSKAVISKQSITKYLLWKKLHKTKWKFLYKTYKKKFAQFIKTLKKPHNFKTSFVSFFETFKYIGLQLGSAIHVDAKIHPPPPLQDIVLSYKSIGAGNECALGFTDVHTQIKTANINNNTALLKVSQGIHYVT